MCDCNTEQLRNALASADSALLHAISALSWLPPDKGPIRQQVGKAIDACRAAREMIASARSFVAISNKDLHK